MAALRRWTPFLGAFAQIDATIEAAAAAAREKASREAFRCGRDRIVEALRVAADDDDDGVAEEIGALLDAAMAESLVTLRDAVPASAVKGTLASGEVVAALGELMTRHASARVRGLARDVVRGWRAGVEEEVLTATSALRVLDGASSRPLPRPMGGEKTTTVFAGGNRDDVAAKKQAAIIPEKKKPAIVAGGDVKKQAEILPEKEKLTFPKKPEAGRIVRSRDAKTAVVPEPKTSDPIFGRARTKVSAYTEASAEIPAPPPPKKTLAPTTIRGVGDKRMTMVPPKSSNAEEMKMQDTKRKLHERYQQAEDAKRRRTIQVIEAPLPPPPPLKRAAGRASCAGERRFLVSSIPRRV